MKTKKNSRGHIYADVDNIRVTYIPAKDRDGSEDRSGSDMIRVQSYRSPTDRSLRVGPEFPVSSPDVFGQFVAAIYQVYAEGRDKPKSLALELKK